MFRVGNGAVGNGKNYNDVLTVSFHFVPASIRTSVR